MWKRAIESRDRTVSLLREKEWEREKNLFSMIREEPNGRNEWKIGNLRDQRGRGSRNYFGTRDQWNLLLIRPRIIHWIHRDCRTFGRSPSCTLQVFLVPLARLVCRGVHIARESSSREKERDGWSSLHETPRLIHISCLSQYAHTLSASTRIE